MQRSSVAGALACLLGCGPAVATTSGDDSTDTSGHGSEVTTTSGSSSVSASSSVTDTTSGSSTAVDTSTASDASLESGIIDDLHASPDLPPACRRGGLPRSQELAQLWVIDDDEGTVSKLDRTTVAELGRYAAAPNGVAVPHSISVGLNGDVAMSIDGIGVTVLRGDLDACDDPDGSSTGPDDVRPWPDGCLRWHTPNNGSLQTLAWTTGELDPVSCEYVGAKIWVGDFGGVLRLDGETGVIEEIVATPGVEGLRDVGVVDSAGNFWTTGSGLQPLVRIDALSLAVESWPNDTWTFDLAVDDEDDVWMCSHELRRLDYDTSAWDVVDIEHGFACAIGYGDELWSAENPIVGFDIGALAIGSTIDLPMDVHEIGVDVDGLLWAAAISGTSLHRIDPTTGAVETFERDARPVIRGDFTGFALARISGLL